MAARKRSARDRALEHVNNLPKHRRRGPVRDPGQSFVMLTGALLCIGMLLWAAGTVIAYVFDLIS